MYSLKFLNHQKTNDSTPSEIIEDRFPNRHNRNRQCRQHNTNECSQFHAELRCNMMRKRPLAACRRFIATLFCIC